jgi:hypothetical protein
MHIIHIHYIYTYIHYTHTHTHTHTNIICIHICITCICNSAPSCTMTQPARALRKGGNTIFVMVVHVCVNARLCVS